MSRRRRPGPDPEIRVSQDATKANPLTIDQRINLATAIANSDIANQIAHAAERRTGRPRLILIKAVVAAIAFHASRPTLDIGRRHGNGPGPLGAIRAGRPTRGPLSTPPPPTRWGPTKPSPWFRLGFDTSTHASPPRPQTGRPGTHSYSAGPAGAQTLACPEEGGTSAAGCVRARARASVTALRAPEVGT